MKDLNDWLWLTGFVLVFCLMFFFMYLALGQTQKQKHAWGAIIALSILVILAFIDRFGHLAQFPKIYG